MTATALQQASVLLEPLSLHIALLDKTGRIVLTNLAWKQFAAENGGGETLDTNYLEACTEEVRRELHRVLLGEAERWEYDYPCHSPQQRRFFKMEASRVRFADEDFLMISHQNITSHRLAELQTRSLQAALIVQSELLVRHSFASVHTLQEPLRRLTTTSSGLQTLANGQSEELSERVKKYAEINQRAAQQISALLGSLGQYTQVGISSDEVPGRFDLHAAFAEEAEVHNLKTDIGALPPVTISPLQGRQLVKNLLLNFSDLCGPSELLEVRGDVENEYLHVHLRLRQLDEQQAQEVLKVLRGEGKSGLELANMLTLHYGGRIWLASDSPHIGLHVTLPLWSPIG